MVMAEPTQSFEVAQLWDAAFAQREMAHAMAAQRLRTARLRQHKLSQVGLAFALLGLGATAGYMGAGLWSKEMPAAVEQVLVSQYTIAAVSPPSVDQASAPVADLASAPADSSSMPGAPSKQEQPKVTPVTVVPAAAKPSAPIAVLKTLPAAGSNSQAPSPTQGKYYEARIDASIGTALAAPSLKVINVPIDGVLNLDVDGAVRAFKVGDVLPDGSRLKQASAQSGSFETTERRK